MSRGEIRIIGGQFRGRKVPVLDSKGLRPTPNRVRETCFNWLQNDIVGAQCLDCFAGSGALGLEALSRGAAQVVFIDQQSNLLASIEQTLKSWNSETNRVEKRAQFLTLSLPKDRLPIAQQFHLVFLDPPFDLDLYESMFDWLKGSQCLAVGAQIYLESGVDLAQLKLPLGWQWIRAKRSGDVYYGLISTGEGVESEQ